MRNLFLATATVVAALSYGPARAACVPVATVPFSIDAPGDYCLVQDLAASSYGILIQADNVNLDCGGHVIDASAQPASTSRLGILVNQRNYATIRNCTIKGFLEAIDVSGDGNVVRDNVVLAPLARGISVVGDDNAIENNRVSDVGGTNHYSWGAYGIKAVGPSIIRGNLVSGVSPAAGSSRSAYGIYTTSNDSGIIQGNTVRKVLGDGGQIALALAAYASTDAVIKENILVNPPGTYGYALYCSGTGSVTNGNVFQGFDNGISAACTSVPAE